MRFARPAFTGLAFTLLLAAGALDAHAAGTGDPQPAATLLLPYFEVDLDNPEDGVNTTFVVRNANAAATLAHVMIFTDLGVGTLAFDVLLTGFDALTVDLRELFMGDYDPDSGAPITLPVDSPVEDPPPPPIAEVFATDFEDGTFGDWSSFQSRVTKQTLQAWHTGQTSERRELCAGVDHGDNIARGYILVDNAKDFSGDRFPDPEYLGENGVVSLNNVLWGDFELTDPANNFSIGSPLVHIIVPELTNGTGSFYAPYGFGGQRQALQGSWGTRYINGGAFDDGTSIIYWRGPVVPTGPFACGNLPAWVPRGQGALIAFDEDSNPEDLIESKPFPHASGRVAVGSVELPVTPDFGWLFVNFASTKGISGIDQGIIISVSDAGGRFSTGQFGVGMDDSPITEGGQN